VSNRVAIITRLLAGPTDLLISFISLISHSGGRQSSRDPRLPALRERLCCPPGLRLSSPKSPSDPNLVALSRRPRRCNTLQHAATQTSHLRAQVLLPLLGVWHRARAVNCLPVCAALSCKLLLGSQARLPRRPAWVQNRAGLHTAQYKISRNPAPQRKPIDHPYSLFRLPKIL